MKWYEKSGKDGDVVISTRVRLARNLVKHHFPVKLSYAQKLKINETIKSAVMDSNSVIAEDFSYKLMDEVPNDQALSFVEHHLVSPDFVDGAKGRAVLLSKNENIVIMINEEDHIRLQVLKEGFCLSEVYDLADKLDTLLHERLTFAFDNQLGYLTQCPTNLGTAMRASVMLHLPALQENHSIDRIVHNLSHLGLALRGSYGEGSRPIAAMYQLSNQVTLGISESSALDNLERIVKQLILQEREARDLLNKQIETKDLVTRSFGILQSAQIMNNDEFMRLISNVRLGLTSHLITNLDYATIDSLIAKVQPASLNVREGKTLSPSERNILRAKIVSQTLKEKQP